jgi:hypothetical protein
MGDDTRDRLIALESDVKHLTATVDDMAVSVKEMAQLLQQAKGAKWVIITAAAVGGFLSAKLGAFLPWLSLSPKV